SLLGSSAKIIHAPGCEILSPSMIVGRFSVRLHGNVTAPIAGEYHFSIESNDGVRIEIDGTRIIDDWTVGPRRKRDAMLALAKGAHAIVVEYFKGTRGLVTEGDAAELNRNVLRLYWSTRASEPRLVPQ